MVSLFILVPRAGIEPATLGLEVLCSIQLSYRGEPKLYYNKDYPAPIYNRNWSIIDI